MIDDILARLEKVKQTGRGNWLACCPAHEDRRPSMTLRAEDDGRILCHCWTGCAFDSIVEAVGLGWEPWFPPKQQSDFLPPVRRPYPAADVLAALADEMTLVMIASLYAAHGVELPEVERERLWVSYERIQQAREVALG